MATALNRIEAEKLGKRATITKAEADKQKRILEAEAEKKAAELIFEAVNADPRNIVIEGQRALVRTAQWPATTIILPTDVMSLFSRVTGGTGQAMSVADILARLTAAEKQQLLAALQGGTP